ncbi:MAG TPA: hypothetical protein DCS17_07445 [Flavobacterium sp.]|nr:hypothetical protein [Flavobacterium sp.]
MLLNMFFGCKSHKIISENSKDSIKIVEKYVIKHVFDSVFVEKTDTFREFFRGDTVFILKIKWRNTVRLQIKTDTLIVKDSVFVDKKLHIKDSIKENIPFWQKANFAYAVSFLLLVIALIVSRLIKKYMKL